VNTLLSLDICFMDSERSAGIPIDAATATYKLPQQTGASYTHGSDSYPAKRHPGATTMPEDHRSKPIPTNQLRQEPGAHDLATSPDMEPYLNFAMAVMQDAESGQSQR